MYRFDAKFSLLEAVLEPEVVMASLGLRFFLCETDTSGGLEK